MGHYVGARYVPKFANPLEWAENTAYEAMTVVSYNNNSYTSKIPVPPTVGNPANNPKYWALTGNYNAQVEQYRQETANVNTELTTEIQNRKSADTTLQNNIDAVQTIATNNARKALNGRRFLFIGDSFTVRENNWPSLVISRLRLTKGDNAFVIGAASHGFIGDTVNVTGDMSYKTLVKQNINTVTDKDTITDIYLLGGTNDLYVEPTDALQQAVKSTLDYLYEMFPNAIVYYGVLCWPLNKTYIIRVESLYNYYAQGATGNACFIPDVSTWYHYSQYVDSDNIHPTSDGQALIAQGVTNHILGKNNKYTPLYIGSGFTSVLNGASQTKGGAINSYLDGNICRVYIDIYFNNIDAFNLNGYTELALCTLDNFIIYGTNSCYLMGTINIEYENGTKRATIPCLVHYYGGEISIKLNYYDGTGTSKVFNNVTSIALLSVGLLDVAFN